MQKDKASEINFAIVNIRESSFQYIEPPEEIVLNFLNNRISVMEKIRASINTNYKWNFEANLFNVVLNFKYTYLEEKGELLLFNYTTITEFVVSDLKMIFVDKGNGDFEMNEQFETTFVGLAISSGRGMMSVKTAGTFMSNFVFPIINPQDVILSKKLKKSKEKSNQDK